MMDFDTLRRAPRLLQTPRLTLEAPKLEHAEAFAAMLNVSLDAWRFIGFSQAAVDLAWAEDFCRRGVQFIDDGECLIFNAFERDSGACIGRIDLHSFDFDAPRCEIGYVGDVRHAGRGLMREAVLAVMALGFELGLARIEAFSDLRNVRALHFAETVGFRREGTVRHRERDPRGELCEQAMFARLREDVPPPCA